MRAPIFAVLLSFATLVALPSARAASHSAHLWETTYPIADRAALHLITDDGDVRVHTWDKRQIAIKVSSQGWQIGERGVRIHDRQDGDHVKLEVRTPHRTFILFGNRSIRVELHVPRELRSDIRTGDGSISVESLRGETHLNTGDGRIDVDGLDGKLEASTGDGKIRVRGRFDQLNLHTGDGSIEAEIASGSKMTSECVATIN